MARILEYGATAVWVNEFFVEIKRDSFLFRFSDQFPRILENGMVGMLIVFSNHDCLSFLLWSFELLTQWCCFINHYILEQYLSNPTSNLNCSLMTSCSVGMIIAYYLCLQ